MKLIYPLLALALVLTGCTTAPRYEAPLGFSDLIAQSVPGDKAANAASLPRLSPGAVRAAYRLGPGDELSVTVWGPREVWQDIVPQGGGASRATVVVQDDGAIVLPLVRRIDVNGATLSEALARISEAYRRADAGRFQVDAAIAKARPQTVLIEGAVAKPGLFTLSPEGSTLGEAVVGGAGGLLEAALPSRGLLVRGGEQFALDWEKAQDGVSDLHRVVLQAGDRVFFPQRRAGVVYVFGEVTMPGMYTIPPQGMTVLQALATAKGPMVPQADQREMVLIRMNESTPSIFRFSLEQALSASEVALLPGDRLFVPSTGLTDWERTLRQIIPILGVAPR